MTGGSTGFVIPSGNAPACHPYLHHNSLGGLPGLRQQHPLAMLFQVTAVVFDFLNLICILKKGQ